MISEDSLLTTRRVLASQRVGTVTRVVQVPAVTHVVHHDAIAAGANPWWNWSPNDEQGPQDYTPGFPTDPRGTWHFHPEDGGPDQDTFGTFRTGRAWRTGNALRALDAL